MIVDFHTHCFPDALAPRAMAALSRNAATLGMNPFTDATLSDNEAHLRRAGVTHFVVCNIATNPRQQTNVNSFAIELTKRGDHIHPLGSLHPDGEGFEGEILRLKAAGIKGLKLHPDYVGVEVDDPRFMRLFELCERNGLFAVIHAGFDPVSPRHMHAPPRAIHKVLERFPSLTLIAAHMGGPLVAREVLDVLVGTPVYLDTSLSSTRAEEKEALWEILQRHDPDRLLLGSDTPWSSAEREIAFVREAPIPESTRRKILWGNAARLLGLA